MAEILRRWLMEVSLRNTIKRLEREFRGSDTLQVSEEGFEDFGSDDSGRAEILSVSGLTGKFFRGRRKGRSVGR